MYHELTNLLPSDRSRALRREYFARLGVVALSMLAILVVIHAVLLLPTYLSIRDDAQYERARLAELETALASSEEQQVGSRLARLANDTAYLTAQAEAPSGSDAIRAVLLVPRAGISITNVSYTASPTAGENRLVLMGVAETRDTLRRYYSALSSQPFVSKADLPISTYAKETDLVFTITLTGTLTP